MEIYRGYDLVGFCMQDRHRQTDRQTDRKTDRQAGRQAGSRHRQTDSQRRGRERDMLQMRVHGYGM